MDVKQIAMDVAAEAAEADLMKLCNSGSVDYGDSLRNLAQWWERWYLQTGHKRLGRILLQYAKKE